MTNHDMSLNPIAFADIKNGDKTIEVRINDEKRQRVKIGDIIIFWELPDKVNSLQTLVKGRSEFANFDDLYLGIDPAKVGYKSEETAAECAAGTRQYYSKEDEGKYGVVGIHLNLF